MKKHETLEMNAETFDKIHAAIKDSINPDNPWEYLYKQANASKYAEWVQSSLQGTKFLFEKGKLKFIIANVGPGRKIVKFMHIADKDPNQEVENWAYENYPKLFKNLDWMVFQYEDSVTGGYTDEGVVEFISAPTKKLAMENTKANPSKDDSFWQNHGCVKISKQDINQKKKQIKQKADHYTKLVKQFGK